MVLLIEVLKITPESLAHSRVISSLSRRTCVHLGHSPLLEPLFSDSSTLSDCLWPVRLCYGRGILVLKRQRALTPLSSVFAVPHLCVLPELSPTLRCSWSEHPLPNCIGLWDCPGMFRPLHRSQRDSKSQGKIICVLGKSGSGFLSQDMWPQRTSARKLPWRDL